MKVYSAKFWVFLFLFIFLTTNIQFAFYKKLPDLSVSALNCATKAKAGTTIQNVVTEISNKGKRPAEAFQVKYYLSLDTNLSANDVDTGTVCEFAELARKSSTTCQANVSIPATLAQGQYYLIASVDEQNSIAEGDEENNSKAFGPIEIEKAADDNPPPPPPPPPTEKIKVDGDPDDWQNILPLYTDEAGDGPFDASGQYQAGSDIIRISVVNDNQNVFFLIEFAGIAHAGGVRLFFDTDVNPTTGCSAAEMAIFSSSEQPYALKVGDYRNCELTETIPGAVTSAVMEKDGHSYLEASISIDDLFHLSPGRQDFRFQAKSALGGTNDEVWPPTVYSLTSQFEDGANLQIRFNSDRVTGDYAKPCGSVLPGLHYGLTLTETAGVGITITGYHTVLYDINGGYLVTISTNSGEDFARLFNGCGDGGAYIKPNGTACSDSLCLSLGGRSAAQLGITFSGVDDKGHPVRFTSGRLILQK